MIWEVLEDWLTPGQFRAFRHADGGGLYRVLGLVARESADLAQQDLDRYAKANGLEGAD